MRFFFNFFDKVKNRANSVFPFEYNKVIEFNNEFSELLKKDAFLARSDYSFLLTKYDDIYVFFNSCKTALTLEFYCKQNKINKKEIETFLQAYEDIKDLRKGSSIINKHNEQYIISHLKNEKTYFDVILQEIDRNILLDEEQRRVVLSDEDYTLIIAGAGAGKTTTIAAKVRYLVEKKHVDPKQILVISFTNKAVGELKERINDGLKIPCPITTFHSAGYAILSKQDVEKKNIVGEGFLFKVVNDYLIGNILDQPENVDKLILFFGSYFDAPYEGNDINLFFNYITKADFSTLRSNVNEYNEQIIDRRNNKLQTITNEVLRSAQEVRIANYLYLNNIDYEYEAPYQYHILKAKKPYTPDFCIKQGNKTAYIEHFGITEDGRHSFYTPEELSKYKQEINDKISLHRKHKTTLIYTFSQYRDGRDFLEHLQEQLQNNGFVLRRRSSQEVFDKLVATEENKYISKLVKLICVFINNFKTNGYGIDDFYRFERSTSNVRNKLFLDICKACYLEYQKQLGEMNAIDFQDMINDSARILRDKAISNEKLDFKYIIVDEYQDISRQRFDLTKELSKLCSAKIIAVGDDWQSIYAFSGSDITLFTHFCSIMGYGQELKITRTYRNAQEVIDIAGNFIQKNESQIKKSLISTKHIQKPVIIETYSEEYDRKQYQGKGGRYYHLGKQLESVIGQILKNNKEEGKSPNSPILLIGRYGFDANKLCFSSDFVYDEQNGKLISKKYKNARLVFLTAHSSKGLGYDNVIIVNARNEIYGFPSKVDNDPVMQYVVKDDKTIDYAEERRLFYVAMTRTKNRVYIITPEQHPSEFILELIREYPNVLVIGQINEEVANNTRAIKKCPICGYPLQLKWNKNYGLRLWICTNEPEVCGFMTNDLNGGELSIQKCPKCRDGYLVVKQGVSEPILGCTNYKHDKTGCDCLMSKDYYKRWRNSGFEDDLSIDKPSFLNGIEQKMPKVISQKPAQQKDTERTAYHKTAFSEKYIEKDGFLVIVDDEGNIITDMNLLRYLRGFRIMLMKNTNLPAYRIVSNKGLVSLATYRPETKEEYLRLNGLGEVSYMLYGKMYIEEIQKYYRNKK